MITTKNKNSTKISIQMSEPLELSLKRILKPIDNDEFLRLSRDNQDIQIEMNSNGT